MSQKGNVDVCPVTKEAWEERAKAKSGDCGGQSVYHCLTDSEDGKWERCVEKSLIKEGFCPIFTNKGFIDWKPCNISIPTCPNISYVSDEVYKYSHCFGNNSLHKQTGIDHNNADRVPVGAIIGVVVGLFILVSAAVIAVWFICFRRKPKNQNTKDEEDGLHMDLLSGDESDEIVKEHNVVNGTALLSRDEVRSIVVVGKFGNSVSSTSRRILKTFQERMKWNSLECQYTDIPRSVDENTIVFVYGWFGLWNDDLCSDRAKTACKSLIQILSETRNLKVIAGMRSDLYRKYHDELDKEVDDHKTSLVHYEINLDSGGDINKDDEYSKFLNDQIKKPCDKSECACKRLEYEMLRKGDDKVVGMPLKIRIIEKYHDIIPNYLHHWDMLKVMVDYFTAIEKDEKKRKLYEWIVYICLKGNFSPGSFDTNLVKKIGFIIDELSFKLTFDDKDSELCKYIMRNSDKQKNMLSENVEYVFWHPFIYICAFHYLFRKNPEFVLKHCNAEAVLQLVRPRGFKTSYFEVTADDQYAGLIYERICLLNKEAEYANHPFVTMGRAMKHVEAIEKGMKMFLRYTTHIRT